MLTPDKRRRILVHILNEGNVLSWDFVLLQDPPHDISPRQTDITAIQFSVIPYVLGSQMY